LQQLTDDHPESKGENTLVERNLVEQLGNRAAEVGENPLHQPLQAPDDLVPRYGALIVDWSRLAESSYPLGDVPKQLHQHLDWDRDQGDDGPREKKGHDSKADESRGDGVSKEVPRAKRRGEEADQRAGGNSKQEENGADADEEDPRAGCG
jgi:hypothetical protein